MKLKYRDHFISNNPNLINYSFSHVHLLRQIPIAFVVLRLRDGVL